MKYRYEIWTKHYPGYQTDKEDKPMKKKLIRTDVMNFTLKQWEKVHEIEKSGFIKVTPKELIDLIGFSGGMFFTAKANEREKGLSTLFMNLGERWQMNANVSQVNAVPAHQYQSRHKIKQHGICAVIKRFYNDRQTEKSNKADEQSIKSLKGC